MAQEDILVTMQKDLEAAVAKPKESVKWGMLIDTRKCVGCYACTIGCVSEYKLPPGVVYRPVLEEEKGAYPGVQRTFLPRPCMQCENPSCVKVCPVGATFKQADGIVAIDYNKCIGCRSCLAACPYGARSFDTGAYYTTETPELQLYEKATFYEYGQKWSRSSHSSPVVGSARKCSFCTSRLSQGMLPVCVTTCIGRATYFGDLNDKNALINKVLGSAQPVRLKESLGTSPQVFYITGGEK